MQRKGIMLIVFLECFISGHGEAGKSNKSILPFVKQFILSWASRKGIEIKSVKHSNSFLCLNHYLDWILQEIWASECIQVFLTICNILLYSSASSQRLSIGSTVSYILKIILRSIFFFCDGRKIEEVDGLRYAGYLFWGKNTAFLGRTRIKWQDLWTAPLKESEFLSVTSFCIIKSQRHWITINPRQPIHSGYSLLW